MVISTTVLVLRKMQIKTTMTYDNEPNGLSKIEKDWQKEYSGGCGVTGTLSHCWWKYTWYSTCERVLIFL